LNDEDGNLAPALTLTKTHYLPTLEGKKWKDEAHPESEIGQHNQLLIKRSKIDVKIILSESSEHAKYELFQRLNTGGSQLSEQEIRNVLLIMENREFYQWVRELALDNNFQLCIGLSADAGLQQYDVDLVLRFLILRTKEEANLTSIGDIEEYLNVEAIALARRTPYDRDHESAAFKFTFAKLAETLSEDSFRRFDQSKNRRLGKFLLSVYEVMALGLGNNYERCLALDKIPNIDLVSQNLWINEEFKQYSGSGVRASSRIPHTVPLGRKITAP
jgi:hypothetical protein